MPTPADGPAEFLTPAEAAVVLRLPEGCVLRLIRRGRLPAVSEHLGRAKVYRINRRALEALGTDPVVEAGPPPITFDHDPRDRFRLPRG